MIDDNEQLEPQQDDEPETGENGTGEGEEVLDLSEEAEAETEEEPKPKNPVQERIDTLVGRAKDAERDAEYWRAKALENQQPEKQPETQSEESSRPKPENYEFGDADPAYWEALTEWKADEKVNARLSEFEQKRQVSHALETLEQGYATRVAQVKEEIPDYDEKVTKTAARGEWPCSPVIAIAAKESEVGPKILHHLATNVTEAVAISNLSPIEQAMAFGRLEARFTGQTAPQPNIATKSPEPAPARTKGGQFAPSGRLDDRAATDDWMKQRNAQVRQP